MLTWAGIYEKFARAFATAVQNLEVGDGLIEGVSQVFASSIYITYANLNSFLVLEPFRFIVIVCFCGNHLNFTCSILTIKCCLGCILSSVGEMATKCQIFRDIYILLISYLLHYFSLKPNFLSSSGNSPPL